MKEPLSIIIFGNSNDDHLIKLKCLLLKCGVCKFANGCFNDSGHCTFADEKPGLFIVSRDSISDAQLETLNVEAQRWAIPILQF